MFVASRRVITFFFLQHINLFASLFPLNVVKESGPIPITKKHCESLPANTPKPKPKHANLSRRGSRYCSEDKECSAARLRLTDFPYTGSSPVTVDDSSFACEAVDAHMNHNARDETSKIGNSNVSRVEKLCLVIGPKVFLCLLCVA